MKSSLVTLCLIGLLISVSAASTGRVLVVLQDVNAKGDYSIFLDSLKSLGFDLDIKSSKDSSIKLKSYDTYQYEHLVLFTPKAEVFGTVGVNDVFDFIDSGHNVIMALGSEVSETMRFLAGDCGVDLDDKSTRVIDHFQYAVTDGAKLDHSLIAATDILNSTVVLGSGIKAPVLFKGIGHTVQPNSELVTVALSAPATSYSHDPRKSLPEPPSLLVGSGVSLVSVVQARNNARVLVSGSLEMFSNKFMNAPVKTAAGQEFAVSGNKEFCSELARWTLQDKAVIKADNLRHHILGSDVEPSIYRVSDDVEFLVDIFLYEGGQKMPFKADDVQVEFVMLDPYVRLPLTHDGEGTFKVAFKVPDVYGVFKYTIDYKHLGYSYVQMTKQVPVRPFKHDEYDRFLSAAYPYYASAATTMAAFFVLGFFFLYHK
jgi:oligosaccharyltransferase complex subunit beta